MEAAAVDIEVDVAAVKIGGAGLPHHNLRVHRLDSIPNGLADALALDTDFHIEEGQLAMMFGAVNGDNGTSHALAVDIDSFVGLGALGSHRLIEVPIGQHLPLVGVIGIFSDMPMKAALECLLHFLLEGDSTLLSEPDKSDSCFH